MLVAKNNNHVHNPSTRSTQYVYTKADDIFSQRAKMKSLIVTLKPVKQTLSVLIDFAMEKDHTFSSALYFKVDRNFNL